MIRDFRVTDAPRLLELLGSNFPVEEQLYGMRPEGWMRVIQRIHRWDVRFLVGLLRAFRRPIFRLFTVDVDGRIAATTLLTYAGPTGYLSMVMVDTPYRRRGYARRLLEHSRTAARAAGKSYVALDVFADNAPAIVLYRSMGFSDLREVGLFARSLESAPTSTNVTPRTAAVVRPFRPNDRGPLFAISARTIPASVAKVLPPRRAAIGGSDFVDRILSSTSASWVLEENGTPLAWTAVSVSDAMEAAALANPIVDERADPAAVAGLVRTATEWARERGAGRIVAQAPLEHARSVAALEAAGFALRHRLLTLYRPAR